MNEWTVQTGQNNFDTVKAHSLQVNAGCLVFYNENKDITLSIAPGQWMAVVLEDE